QGIAWRQQGFPDGSWSNGIGLFGFETTSNVYLPDPFRSFLTPPNQGGPVTAYFRTHFTWPQVPPPCLMLRATALLDDGAVFYLNGVEVGRLRVPPNQVFQTLATNQASEGQPEELVFLAETLAAGDNLLAVELHQSAIN